MKPMTMKKLIDELQDMDSDGCELSDGILFIEANREALELGMQRPLKIVIRDHSYLDCNDVMTPSFSAYIGEPDFFHLLHTVEAQLKAKESLIAHCEKFATESLNLPCEFIEE